MPKSKRGKGRRFQNKNRPAQRPVTQAQAAPANKAAMNTAAPVAVKPVAAPKAAISTAATTAQYPFFTSELKRIGVITLILVIALIVLAFVFK